MSNNSDQSNARSLFPFSHMHTTPEGREPPHTTRSVGPWVYDPAFGIVHLCGCRVCRDYIMHVSGVQEFDVTHARALRQRDAELRSRFMDGFRHGRESQQQHDNERLKAYRSQRDAAQALNSLYGLQLEEAKQEITILQDELLALRIAYDELLSSPSSDPERLDHEENVLPQASDSDSSSPPDLAFDTSSASESSSESDMAVDWEQGLDSDSDEDDAVQVIGGPAVQTDDTTPSQLRLHDTGIRATDTSAGELGPAHAVPASDGKPLEVYVDASGKGIGFVFNGQWEAWKPGKGWHKRQRHTQWMEAVAAELGVRLMIEAGYSQSRIVLRSDNSGVVQALSEQDFNEPQMGEIIRNIHSLCCQHGITLDIKWIRGGDNPADDPSRMRLGSPSQRFPFFVSIPAHLQEFVTPLPREKE